MDKAFITGTVIAATLIVTSSGTYAQFGGPNQRGGEVPEHRQEIQESLASGDYQRWRSLMEEYGGPEHLLESINEDNFSSFSELQELIQNRDFEEARELGEELGLRGRPGRGPQGNNGRGPDGNRGNGGPDEGADQRGPLLDEDQREALKAAAKNGDYSTWISLHEEYGIRTPFGGVITADNFSRFVEMHELMKSGDREAAKAIADELGIEQRPGQGSSGQGNHEGAKLSEDQRETLKEAAESGDYDLWVSLHAEYGIESPFGGVITADNFSQFVEMHELMKSGDSEGAKAIADELGLQPKRPGNRGQGFGRGNGNQDENGNRGRGFGRGGRFGQGGPFNNNQP